ncbi:MAG TPA: hypothetical protein VM425_16680 [Myxococcota bacterium]|nr:hypothetical protein [Myxococcota bacterium]
MSGSRVLRFSAPGKLFLMGEYAVREGFPAVVMSVDRYVRLQQAPSSACAGNELPAFARSECARLLGLEKTTGAYRADSSCLQRRGIKLGLGSSAAVTVCAVASVFHQQGRDIEDGGVRREMWHISRRVHDSFQKVHGSGADLAASIFGKALVVDPARDDGLTPLDGFLPTTGFELLFLWTSRPSSTPRFVSAVDDYRRADPAGYREIVGEMGELVERFIEIANEEGGDVRPLFSRYFELMDLLGERSGSPIIDRLMRIASQEVQRAGGALKPSGAGGGDILLATFPKDIDRGPFLSRMSDLGLQPVALGMARHGVQAEVA